MRFAFRSALVVSCLFGAASAWAQINLGGPLGGVAAAVHAAGTPLPPGQAQNPREPTGFPQPQPPASDELPPPQAAGSDERMMRILESGETSTTGNKVQLENGFHVRYKGYDIYGDTLDGDRNTEVFTATGNVRLLGQDEAVNGEAVTFDFRNNTYVATKMQADLHPTFFPSGTVIGDVYVYGGTSYGSRREMFGEDSYVTTCDLPDPHYKIFAKKIDLRPGRRIILRGSTLYILNKKILSIPYLAIPLDNRGNHIYPEVGDDPTAGYYVKLFVPIPLHGNDAILTGRLDEYQKLGTGIGADYDYQTRKMNGQAEIYTIVGKSNEQDLTLQHQMMLGKDNFSLFATYSNNDYLSSPGSNLLNLRTQLSIPERNGSFDQFSFSEGKNSNSGFNSNQLTAAWNDSRNWTPKLRTTLNLAYNDTTSSTGGQQNSSYDNRLLDVQFDANDDLKKATAEFQYSRNIPIGSNAAGLFGSLDQSPSITVKTDSSRLLSQKLAIQYPFQTDLSFGQYGAPSLTGVGSNDVWRSNFDFSFTRPDHPDRRFDYTFDTRFQQGVYSDNTAQYVTGFDFSTRYNLGPDTAWNIHYNYLQQHGYAPIPQDLAGQTNLITSDISLRPVRSLLFAAQTGYDMLAYQEGTPGWQDVGLRMEWTPKPYFQMRSLATYDTNLKNLSTIEFDLAWKPGSTFVSTGFRYDESQHTIGEWDLYVDALKWRRMKSSLILDYDGYIHQFTAEHVAMTYDLHCAEAVLEILNNPQGFRSGLTVNFFLRLKAFPFNTPFGVGTQGQAVGAGFGRTTF